MKMLIPQELMLIQVLEIVYKLIKRVCGLLGYTSGFKEA